MLTTFFAGEVTAAFAEDLVFDVEAGDACLDILLNGFGDHEGSAVSSIHIRNQGWAIGVKTCNHLGIGLHVMKLRETQVGHTQS